MENIQTTFSGGDHGSMNPTFLTDSPAVIYIYMYKYRL